MVCVSVRLFVTVILLPCAMQRPIGNTNGFSTTRVTKIKSDFLETTSFKSYGVEHERKSQLLISTGLLRPVCSRYEINKAQQLLEPSVASEGGYRGRQPVRGEKSTGDAVIDTRMRNLQEQNCRRE